MRVLYFKTNELVTVLQETDATMGLNTRGFNQGKCLNKSKEEAREGWESHQKMQITVRYLMNIY